MAAAKALAAKGNHSLENVQNVVKQIVFICFPSIATMLGETTSKTSSFLLEISIMSSNKLLYITIHYYTLLLPYYTLLYITIH